MNFKFPAGVEWFYNIFTSGFYIQMVSISLWRGISVCFSGASWRISTRRRKEPGRRTKSKSKSGVDKDQMEKHREREKTWARRFLRNTEFSEHQESVKLQYKCWTWVQVTSWRCVECEKNSVQLDDEADGPTINVKKDQTNFVCWGVQDDGWHVCYAPYSNI